MSRFLGLSSPWATTWLCLCGLAVGCGGSGGSVDGTGGTGGGTTRFCETDAQCLAGATNPCSEPSCDTSAGVCTSTPLPEGTACNDNAGVCRNGYCAPTELKAYVKSPNPEPNALFGNTVSVLGDRMIVGAPSSGPGFGKVAVFDRDTGGQWSVTQQIDTPLVNGAPNGLFGWSVASAQGPDPGVLDDFFVVGSMGFNLGGGGSVRVFRNRNGEWVFDSAFGYIVPQSNPVSPFDLFAASVALTPNGETLVVGSPGHSSGEPPVTVTDRDYSGAAYVFINQNSIWTEEALLKASNAGGSYVCEDCGLQSCPTSGEGDGFGVSVAISGETLVVGAPGEASAATGVNGNESDDSAPGAGAAYVFERIDGTWQQTAYLKASNTDAGDRFGFAVAIAGDMIAIGAEREDSPNPEDESDNSAENAGAVYIFERMGGVWEQIQYLKASNAEAGFLFGANLAMSDTTLVVGSPGESSVGGPNSGAAYVFSLAGGMWTQTNFYKAFNADADSQFAGPQGSVYFADPIPLLNPCEAQSTTKGSSLSLSGDTLVVGAPYEDSAAVGVNGVPTSNAIPNSGAVYVFDNSEQ